MASRKEYHCCTFRGSIERRRVPQVRFVNLGPGVVFSFSPFCVHGQKRTCRSVVISPTTPRPILWMLHQSANHRIRVHVIQFLLLLSVAVHVEIVKSRLPEGSQRFSHLHKGQSHLSRAPRPSALSQFPRHTELQLLQRHGGRFHFRLAYQQMYVFRHHHIAEDTKSHLVADPPQFFYEDVPRVRRLQQRQPPVTTERNKMQIAFAVVALQSCGHRKSKEQNVNPKTQVQKPNLGHPPPLNTSAESAAVILFP